MSKIVEIKFEADTSDAIESTKKLEGEVKGVGKAASDSKKGFGSMSKAIKGVGVALKAAGIGLVVALVAGLTEAFSRNKKVMDGVSIVMNTIQNVFSQVATALINTYNAIAKSSENFDALGKVISGLLTIGLAPLQIAFYGIIAAAEGVKLAYEKMFGDEKTIAEAQKNLDITNDKLKQIALDVNKAGSDIVSNIGEAIDEVGAIGTKVVKELSDVSVGAAFAQAKIYKEVTDASIIAQAEAGRLVAQYERQSEIQRQLRDDTSVSIDERIAANAKLGEVLDKQEEQLLKQADLVIAAAQAELLKNDSIENQAALIDALAAKEQVVSDITGKRSEQLVNEVGLLKEKNDLENAISEGLIERNRTQKEFDAERELNPMVKLEMQRKALDDENKIIEDDLARKRELYAEGTAERVAAEEDYKNKKQNIDNKILKNEDDTNALKLQNARSVENAKLQIASMGLDVLGSLAKEGSDLSKGIAVAQTSINTYQGISAALAAVSTIPEPFGQALKVANAVAVGVSGLMNVQKILATKPVETNAPNVSDVGGASGGAATPPSFNLVEGSADNQIQNSIQGAGSTPLRAYVVAQDVTSQQSLDRQIESNSGI